MSEQTMKILKMLEEGKITADEAGDLITRIDELEEETARSEADTQSGAESHGEGYNIPHVGGVSIPPVNIPDVGRIVNQALHEALGSVVHARGPKGTGGANAEGTHFAGANLDFADLTDTKLDNQTKLEGADLRFTSFVDADLRGADLRGANLSHSDFTDAKLNGVDLRGAQLHHGNYVDADFRDADLRGADLSLSNLMDASFKNVKHQGLVLRGMTMVGMKYETVVGSEMPQDPTPPPQASPTAAGAEGEVVRESEAAAEEPAASWTEGDAEAEHSQTWG